jgi:hypothetical protein
VGILISKEVLKVRLNWTSFYSQGVIILSVLGVIGAIFSLSYFAGKNRELNINESSQVPAGNHFQFE